MTAFALSMFVVTFLHLVAGEMASKSWAIAHPEKPAMAVGMISRAYLWPLRPLLIWVNRLANRLVRASSVEPVEKVAVGGRDAATIRQLVEHSGKAGTLEPGMQRQLSGLIDLGSVPVASLVAQGTAPTCVGPAATVADVRAAGHASGHMRILMTGTEAAPAIVHLRDTLMMPDNSPASDIARPAHVLTPLMPVCKAPGPMRAAGVQLAVIMDGDRTLGVVSLSKHRQARAADPRLAASQWSLQAMPAFERNIFGGSFIKMSVISSFGASTLQNKALEQSK